MSRYMIFWWGRLCCSCWGTSCFWRSCPFESRKDFCRPGWTEEGCWRTTYQRHQKPQHQPSRRCCWWLCWSRFHRTSWRTCHCSPALHGHKPQSGIGARSWYKLIVDSSSRTRAWSHQWMWERHPLRRGFTWGWLHRCRIGCWPWRWGAFRARSRPSGWSRIASRRQRMVSFRMIWLLTSKIFNYFMMINKILIT